MHISTTSKLHSMTLYENNHLLTAILKPCIIELLTKMNSRNINSHETLKVLPL